MLENLSKTDYIILAILVLIILIAGIILVVFIKKSKKTTVLDYAEEKEETPIEEKKPVIGMQLACENIPPVLENPEFSNTEEKEEISSVEEETEEISSIEQEKKEPEVPSIEQEEKEPEISSVEQQEKEIPTVIEEYEKKEENIESEPDKMDEQVVYIENNEMENNQDKKTKTNIDEILKAMQIDLEKERFAKIDKYEEEQEQEAVISYQELRKKMQQKEEEAKEKLLKEAMTKVELVEEPIYKDLPDTPKYSNNDFFDILDKNEIEQNTKKEDLLYDIYRESIKDSYVYEPKKQVKEVRKTEFISPVFGRDQYTGEYQKIEKPNTTVIEKPKPRRTEVLHDINETDAFLNTLKEFRNNL